MIIPAIRNTIKNTIIDPLNPHGVDFKALMKAAGGVLYLDARKATGNGLPSNNPLTGQWMDLSGLGNNATPTNFAGTAASGVDVSDPLRPFWVLDGTDDFFSLVNSASIDITSAPLAVFLTIATAGQGGYVVCKNLDATINTQYGIYYDSSDGSFGVSLEGGFRGWSSVSAGLTNIWVNIGFVWDGTNIRIFKNGTQTNITVAYSATLTSRPNLRVGRRETATSYFKGKISTVSVYSGTKATEANVLKAEKAISRAYIGG
jgi:hypothetical protein